MEPQPFLNIANEHRPKPHPSQTSLNHRENLPTTVTSAVTSDSNRIIRMGTGRCGFQIQFGTLFVPCPCTQGRFSFHPNSGSLKDECTECSHSSSMHQDIDVIAELQPSKEELTTHKWMLLPSKKPLIASEQGIIRREATVAAFFVQLQQVRVIHVRGTPTSGKTTLSFLLHDHILTKPDFKVIWIVWREKKEINWLEWTSREDTVLIVDEAQASYDDELFWANLVKPVANNRRGPMIALFGSYGSPEQGPGRHITPMHFAIEQRMSIRPLSSNNMQLSIFFTRPEFEDFIRLMKNDTILDSQPFILSADCIEHLWLYSNGHPGGMNALLKFLIDAQDLRKYRKAAAEIPLEDLKKMLNDESNLFSSLFNTGFGRSFPKARVIQSVDGLAKFLESVLVEDCSKEDPSSNECLQKCYHNGWLQAELTSADIIHGKVVYVLPSRIHKRYLEYLLRAESKSFPVDKYPTVEKFCFSAIRAFKRSSLASSYRGLGTSAIQKPLEAQYQDEVYRAAYEILGKQIHLSSEWSSEGSSGRIDFRVRSMKWAIECLREGDRLQQHVARFQPGGIYYKWIEDRSITQFIIIDFRTSMPPKVDFASSHLFFAVFEDDFRSCTIYNASGQKEDHFAVLA